MNSEKIDVSESINLEFLSYILSKNSWALSTGDKRRSERMNMTFILIENNDQAKKRPALKPISYHPWRDLR